MNIDFSHATLRENVATYLRNRILRGEITSGMKINEVEVAGQLGISRGPVREALRQIEQEGFVSYAANRGCTVRTVSPESMGEVYLIRSTLESLAVRVYGGKMSQAGLDILDAQCNALAEAVEQNDMVGIVLADQMFHATIVREAGLERLFRLWSSFDGDNAAVYYTMDKSLPVSGVPVSRNHRILLDAFKEGELQDITTLIQQHYMVVPQELYKIQNQPAAPWVIEAMETE